MLRLIAILRVLLKYELHRLLPERSPNWLRWLLRSRLPRLLLCPRQLWRSTGSKLTPPRALSLALQELGPVYIKLGQVLSTRRDLLEDELADELATLQDKLPAIAPGEAQAAIEASLGKRLNELFAHFDNQALAAASVAQVHRAELSGGEQVIVKLVRPGIERVISQDIAMMHQLARWITALWPEWSERGKPSAIVQEYELTIFAELDMRTEAANCATFAHNFAGSELLMVPKIYWPLVTREVLVQEYFADKIRIDDLDTLRARGVNMQRLAESGVRIFYTQVFRDGFFHADMHPGNVLVDISNPERPVYAGVDFGIVGVLRERDLHYLGTNMLAFFERDYYAIARLHLESGWVQGDVRLEHFEQAIRSICEPLHSLPLAQLSFAQLILSLFAVARRFDLIVQPQLLLFQKTLLNIEGIGRHIYPELDLFTTVWPELKRWQRQRLQPRRLARKARRDLQSYWPYLQELPEYLHEHARQRQEDRALLRANSQAMAAHQRSTRRWRRWSTLLLALLGAALWLKD